MDIRISDELRAYVDPLTSHEYDALERSILAEGCRDALVLWGDVLIDGHNRYAICRKHGLPFKTVQNDKFGSIDDVALWMIDNHLARRSVSDFQRGMLALRKKAILNARAEVQKEAQKDAPKPAEAKAVYPGDAPAPAPERPPLSTREEIAKVAGISSNTISRIEKIQKTAAPELVEAVRTGTISLNAAAAVASLPVEEQVAAVNGGKKELRQIARQVRESKAPPKPPRAEAADEPPEQFADIGEANARIAELKAENASLKARIQQLTIALSEARHG
jgi:transcriptional regulator with XRE-family HTH domain